jgi:hypothetical protein
MSARTAVNHKPSEMKYEGTRDGIAIFSSASKSTGGRNWTYVDVETRQVACECQAKPGTCWHADVAPLAFAMTRVAAYLATLDDATLATVGRAAGALIERRGQTITDMAVLWQARVEFCKRRRRPPAAAALLAQLPDPAVVLAGRRGGHCPDCGEWTTSATICDDCMADLLAQRAGAVAA